MRMSRRRRRAPQPDQQSISASLHVLASCITCVANAIRLPHIRRHSTSRCGHVRSMCACAMRRVTIAPHRSEHGTGSLPVRSSDSTMRKLLSRAMSTGVTPALFSARGSAPRSSSTDTHSRWLPAAAWCSGVSRFSVLRVDTTAPASHSSLTVDAWPPIHAMCNGDTPIPFLRLTSTPTEMKYVSMSSSPRSAPVHIPAAMAAGRRRSRPRFR
mmetsp:Transcript_575/g.1648  ORF Transcript_575/g.1648 Transcript_575/m.1648 type:complete len:213 (+) Transcript_575:344-982(+)